MPKTKNQYPKNCRDRNQAFSWYNGKRIYHGVWGSPEAEQSYKRFVAALLESPVVSPQTGGETDVLVSELAAGFMGHIGNSQMDETSVDLFKRAIGYLIDVYGELAVNDFSPKKLKVCRSQMVKAGTLCRKTINRYTGYIKRVFAWGVEEEIVESNVIHALRVVGDLKKGEQGTFDHPPREDVPLWVVIATLPFLAPVVAAMVMIQWLTGMRPSEVFNMRVGDVDRNQNNGLWYYTPESHKTEKYIGKKSIPLGKPEQELIAPYLVDKKPGEAVFSPRTAMKERAVQARTNRKSKLTPSQRERDAKRAEANASKVGEFYDKGSYRKAVLYAIAKGNRHGQKIPHWTPYLLRNSAATAIELEHGLDKAQAQLGHTSANMTKRYSGAQLKQREYLARNRHNPFDLAVESTVPKK
jgi:integrase